MKTAKAIVMNDLHFPWACAPVIELTLRVAERLDPDIIFLNGDIIDCWEVSSFVKNPSRRATNNIVEEIRIGRKFLADLRARFPKADTHYISGNHEARWMKFLATHAQELVGLKGLTLWEQLECQEQQIEVHDSGNQESEYLWGKLLIGHFDKVNKHSGYTAKNLLEEKGISLIQAHTHRGGSSYKRMWDRDIVAYENFCLCDRNPEYVMRPNWQHGFSIVWKNIKSDQFHVDQHAIIEKELPNGKYSYETIFHGDVVRVG